MSTMVLYVQGEVAHELPLDFTGMVTVEQREAHIDQRKEWLKYRYKKSLTITPKWEIVIEITESKFNNYNVDCIMASIKKICNCCEKSYTVLRKPDVPADINVIYCNLCSNCCDDEILTKNYAEWLDERPPDVFNPNQLTLF